MTEYAVGNLFRAPISTLAEKAALLICAFPTGKARALTADPGGKLMIEPVTSAAESDLIGVYTSGRKLELAARLASDILFERKTRMRAQRRAA